MMERRESATLPKVRISGRKCLWRKAKRVPPLAFCRCYRTVWRYRKKFDPCYCLRTPYACHLLARNIAAPSLWREMDKFALPTPYANHRKKVLLNRHKTGREDGMINGGK
ncbi:hypothetical protein [Rhizobium sp. WYJ-E13]|uniref:hypothetical protein n=1 Tax=Rhizobium sp. WYJ-E13 TaxID=2849093 RepID=UPI001C1EE978|nr:hypothetical protein [Rhizobium sp. WYJ-E13]QWW69269.1 hypothetical protein KQ933_06075 [Rhizobium sp. WYJ-E13]